MKAGVFKMSSKWPLVRAKHFVFFVHVCGGECFFTSVLPKMLIVYSAT